MAHTSSLRRAWREPAARAGRSACMVLAALLLLLTPALPQETAGLSGPAVEPAVRDVRAALEGMRAAMGNLAREARLRLGAEAQLVGETVEASLERLEEASVPVVDPALVHELEFVADVARAIAQELDAAAKLSASEANERLQETVAGLAAGAQTALARIDASVEDWRGRAREEVIAFEQDEGAVLVSSADRTLHDAVRYIALGLFLIGLLALGMRLLSLGETQTSTLDLFKHAPVFASLGFLAVLVFLGASLAVSVSPRILPGLAAETRIALTESPCETLRAQRSRLREAQALGPEPLVEAIKSRMQPAAQDCFRLDSEVAAAETVDWLAESLAPTQSASGEEQATAAAPAAPDNASAAELERLLTAVQTMALEETLRDRLQDVPGLRAAGPALAAAPFPGASAESATQDTSAQRPAPNAPSGTPAGREPAQAGPMSAAGGNERPPSQDQPGPAPDAPESAQTQGRSGPVAPGPARPRDYVTTTSVNYRAGPGLDRQRLGTVPSGTKVLLLGEQDDWANVQLADGRSVYISSEYLRPSGAR